MMLPSSFRYYKNVCMVKLFKCIRIVYCLYGIVYQYNAIYKYDMKRIELIRKIVLINSICYMLIDNLEEFSKAYLPRDSPKNLDSPGNSLRKFPPEKWLDISPSFQNIRLEAHIFLFQSLLPF